MTHRAGAMSLGAAIGVAIVLASLSPVHAARLFVSRSALGGGPSTEAIVDAAVARDLAANPRSVVLEDLPIPGDGASSFHVEPIEIFSPTATIVEFDGTTEKPIARPDVVVYAGPDVTNGDRDVMVSIVGGRRVWAIVRQKGLIAAAIHPRDDANSLPGAHVVMRGDEVVLPDRKLCDNDLATSPGFGGPGSAAAPPPTSGLPPGPTLAAEVLVDVDNDLYTGAFGSDSVAASEYVANLFGAVSVIYRRDANIAVLISQLVIWTTSDPFPDSDTGTQLNAYDSWNESNRAGVPRDTAHLLAYSFGGGRAYLSAMCSTTVGYGVSNINGDLTEFPTSGLYEWDIKVVAHELGHNFGTHHTHCYSPPLDHCYNQEAGCYSGPVEPTIGEIMSYCHLVYDVDMHFSETVASVVRAGAEAASCIGNAPGVCGNGTLDPGEQCDDGNAADGDCCSANCVYEPSGFSTYEYCTDDGDPCTTDVCDGEGTCGHHPPGLCTACGTPAVVPAAGGTFGGTFTGTSTLASYCGGAGPEQVFEWTPARSGTANVKTCNGPTDTVVYVKEGKCDIGPTRGCSDEACGSQSNLDFASIAGTTYFIVVDSYYASSAGSSFVLDVTPGRCGDGTHDVEEECDDGNAVGGDCCSATCSYESTTAPCTDDGDPCTHDVCDGAGACTHLPPGTCDACTVPTVIPAAGGVFTGATVGASTLSGCGGPSPGAERVYEWTPATTGLASISTCGGTTNYDTTLSVRTAGCASILACNDDACGLQSSLTLAVTAGQTYLIVVDGYAGNGNYTLTVSPPVVCGDGIVGGQEECDDGDLDPNDGCTDLCTACGNGVLHGSEECDDGNLVADDGCSPSCRLACPSAPLSGCRLPTLPRKSIIKLKQGTTDTKDVFGWKWGNGAVTPKADFGHPLTTHAYVLCIYDGNGHRFTTLAPAGGTCAGRPCWTEKTTGFKYSDKELSPRGVSKVDLKEGLLAGKAKVNVKGKGALLGLPSTSALASPVRVQLLRPNGPCFEGVFSAPFLKQDGAQFKDLSD